MKLIWTKSNLPLSILIRWVTGEDCSHFAFVFESAAKGVMFESNLMGTHPKFFASAKKHMEIVHSIDVPLTIEQENKLWDQVVEQYDDKPYDFTGAIYLGWRIILKRVFGKPLPLFNPWNQAGTFVCDELYQVLSDSGIFPESGVSTGMVTPHGLWETLERHS